MKRRIILFLCIAFLAVGVMTLDRPATWRWAAARLIDHAWARTLGGAAEASPWPGAESVPVARLWVPRLDKDFIVMKGTGPRVLSFAPGWNEGSDAPGAAGITLISGLPGSSFGFLRDLEKEDVVRLQTADGHIVAYRIEDVKTVTESEIRIGRAADENVLLLATSYPFSNWQEGGAMRVVAVARREKGDGAVTTLAFNPDGLTEGI